MRIGPLAQRVRKLRRALLACGVAATVAVVAALVYWLQPSSAEAELADTLAGERWYAVVFGHKPIGHYHALNRRTEEGHFEFRTLLRFKLASAIETRIEDRLVFHRLAPHLLTLASHTEVVDGEEIHSRNVDAPLALRDYLAVELWLGNASPPVGEVGHSRAVDFDRLAVETQRWRLLRRVGDHVEIAKEGREHDTLVRLDRSFAPKWMRIGELFELHRVADEQAAQAWRSEVPLFASASHRVAVDAPFGQPARLQRLVMAVERDAPGIWPNIVTVDARAARRAELEDVDRARLATLRFPADDPAVYALALRAAAGFETVRDKADALTLFVHDLLEYRDIARPRTVFDTLRDEHGDCTEFADLYTTLARAAGVPARTVVGLAYRAAETVDAAAEGAFALHAWNEVAIDGAWRSVDPTWGLTRLAATHVPLPTDSALAAIAELPRLRFRVLEASYGLAYDAASASASPTISQGEP